VFNARSYARLQTVASNPLTAVDSAVSPYADITYQYDFGHRVSSEVVQGAANSLDPT
jgi:hypothetical protein